MHQQKELDRRTRKEERQKAKLEKYLRERVEGPELKQFRVEDVDAITSWVRTKEEVLTMLQRSDSPVEREGSISRGAPSEGIRTTERSRCG